MIRADSGLAVLGFLREAAFHGTALLLSVRLNHKAVTEMRMTENGSLTLDFKPSQPWEVENDVFTESGAVDSGPRRDLDVRLGGDDRGRHIACAKTSFCRQKPFFHGASLGQREMSEGPCQRLSMS